VPQLVSGIADNAIGVRAGIALCELEVLAPGGIAKVAARSPLIRRPYLVPSLCSRPGWPLSTRRRMAGIAMSGIITVRSAARVFMSSRTSRRPPDSLAVRSIVMHCTSKSTLPIGTATASSQRRPVKARTIATSPRPGLNRSSASASRSTCGMLGMITRRRTDAPQPVRSSSAGLTGMIRSSRAHANSRRSTDATVLLVLPDAGVPSCKVRFRIVAFSSGRSRSPIQALPSAGKM
jgi:hypothetical protein